MKKLLSGILILIIAEITFLLDINTLVILFFPIVGILLIMFWIREIAFLKITFTVLSELVIFVFLGEIYIRLIYACFMTCQGELGQAYVQEYLKYPIIIIYLFLLIFNPIFIFLFGGKKLK